MKETEAQKEESSRSPAQQDRPLAIETHALSRHYGRTRALDSLSLRVPVGSIFAFLGPNGAGKTTTIQTLVNILSPTSGSATVLGVDSTRLSPVEFRRIGYISENQKMPEWMTLRQYLNYCKSFYPEWDDAFCEELNAEFRLPMDRKISKMSRGMKGKTSFLSSLSYRPELLIMDEPFTGLDPLVRDELIKGFLHLTEREKWTIFISSHDIDEVERLADWVGILDKGRLRLCDGVANIRRLVRRIDVVCSEPPTLPRPLPDDWLWVEQAGKVLNITHKAFDCETTGARLREQVPGVEQIHVQDLSLREVFLSHARFFNAEAGEAR